MDEISYKFLPFAEYINLISPPYFQPIMNGLEHLPLYFFQIAPSSTGKYHPQFDHGYGGLVRHTIMALKIATDLIRAEFLGHVYSQEEIDIILIAVLFHDSIKNGDPYVGYTTHNHPILSAQFCHEYVTKGLDIDGSVYWAIASHMGKWNTREGDETVLPRPDTAIDHLVHMADYMASRTYMMYEPEIK